MARILIVDDSMIVRSMYENILREREDYKVCGTLENARAAVLFCMKNQVDLILMDVYTKNRESGLAAAAEIKELYPKIKIIVCTSLPEASFIDKAKNQAHCESFWYKENGDIGLLDIIDRTLAGESIYPESTPVIQIGNAKSVEFTPMEMKVLRALCDGKINKVIAEEMFISENTVKYHINNMLSKAGYSNKYQLAIDAVEKKLIVPGF